MVFLKSENPMNMTCYCSYDASREEDESSIGRLINHSKSAPNICPQLFLLSNIPKIIFVAKDVIPEGTELLCDNKDRSAAALESHSWLSS